MKKILLLGDSIRMGYEPHVKEKLANIAEVVGPAENCRFAKYTLWCVDEWIRSLGAPDVIHWNNGIWDVYHYSEEDGIFTPLDEYVSTMKRVLSRLRQKGTPIVFATTTPVQTHFNFRNEDIDAYNEAMIKLMSAEQVQINDLNAVIKQNLEGYIDTDQLHLTQRGSIACAEAVAEAVKRYI